MHVLLPYILMRSPLGVSCFFQRSNPLVNAHIAASECRASSGGEPSGRAKHRGVIHRLIRLNGNTCFSQINLHTSLEGFVNATSDHC